MTRSGKPWLTALLGVGSVLALSAFSGTSPAASSGWAKAHFIGGVVKPGQAMVTIVSRFAPGNCAADASHISRPFVATEAHGKWSKVIGVPGIKIQAVNGPGQVGTTNALAREPEHPQISHKSFTC